MRAIMRIGDKVTRRNSPAFAGVILERHNGKARVRWSQHTVTWNDLRALTTAHPARDKGHNAQPRPMAMTKPLHGALTQGAILAPITRMKKGNHND